MKPEVQDYPGSFPEALPYVLRQHGEKYIVEGAVEGGGGGGEYPLQDGFGWTNGVTLMLLDMYGGGQ